MKNICTNPTVSLLTSRVDHLSTTFKKRLQLSKQRDVKKPTLQNSTFKQKNILFPNLVKKANNYKSALNNEYIRLLKIGTLMTLALWHLTVAAGMRSQQEIIKIDSCQAS